MTDDKRRLQLAWLTWAVSFVVVIGLLVGGHVNDDPYRAYVAAARRWLSHQPLYETRTIDGFQYLPQAALLLVPFAWLGTPTGDVLWRAIGWGLYALGVWRLARLLSPRRASECFLMATVLSIPPGVGSLANGQANLPIALLTLHASADLSLGRWWRATTALALGLALKPLMAVLLLLAWALHRPMRWRLAVAVGLVLVAPFLVRDHLYVIEQYRACLTKLGMSAQPDRFFEDARGLTWRLGWVAPCSILWAARLLGALGVLAICLRARRQSGDPRPSVMVAGLAVGYLMLFNPRTQSNSYVMTAPIAALLAATFWLEGRRRLALVSSLLVLGWWGNSHSLRVTEYWLKPLCAVGFVALVGRELWRRQLAGGSSSSESWVPDS